MAYEPLNLQNGQVLTAEDVQHIEQGVQDVLPQNPGAYQYPATDGSGNMAWEDMLAYSIPAFNFEYSGSTAGLPSFTVQGDEFTGLKKYYQIAAGDFPLTGFQNMVVRDEGNDNQPVQTFYQFFSSGYHALWFELANGQDGYTRLYWFDGKISVLADETNPDAGTITPEAGIYGKDGGDGTAKLNDAFMCHYNGQTKTIDPKFLPAMESNVFIIAKNDTDRGTDKTWEEIVAAYNSGSAIFLRSGKPSDPEFPQYPMLMPLAYINTSSYDGEATFCGMFYDGTDFRACRTVVRSDGTIGGNQRIITTTTV